MSDTDTSDEKDLGQPPPRWLLKALTRLNVFVYRASSGGLMNKLAGGPICLVTMTGAKSGRTATSPYSAVSRAEWRNFKN